MLQPDQNNTEPSHESGRNYLPTATLETLRLRAGLLSRLRQFFDAHGYWEVETPILSRETVVDGFLEPFVTHWSADTGGTTNNAGDEPFFLQSSPEIGMKRLLVAGARAVYQVTRVMRNGELGRHHNPEFTMIEWYRVSDTHHDQMDFVQQLVSQSAQCFVDIGGVSVDNSGQGVGDLMQQPFERVTYDAAFQRHVGSKVLQLSSAELAHLAGRHAIVAPSGLSVNDRDAWLNLLLVELVEPQLGHDRPVFLYDYPASQAALARVRGDSPAVAERFELYIRGTEICNGYHELTEPHELRERVREQTSIRNREGRRELPVPRRLIAALEAGLPDCAGVALGFDRLMMLFTGAESLREVVAFPWDRA